MVNALKYNALTKSRRTRNNGPAGSDRLHCLDQVSEGLMPVTNNDS